MDTLPTADQNNQNIEANVSPSAPAPSSKKWLIGVVAAVVIIGGGASAFLFGGGMFKGSFSETYKSKTLPELKAETTIDASGDVGLKISVPSLVDKTLKKPEDTYFSFADGSGNFLSYQSWKIADDKNNTVFSLNGNTVSPNFNHDVTVENCITDLATNKKTCGDTPSETVSKPITGSDLGKSCAVYVDANKSYNGTSWVPSASYIWKCPSLDLPPLVYSTFAPGSYTASVSIYDGKDPVKLTATFVVPPAISEPANLKVALDLAGTKLYKVSWDPPADPKPFSYFKPIDGKSVYNYSWKITANMGNGGKWWGFDFDGVSTGTSTNSSTVGAGAGLQDADKCFKNVETLGGSGSQKAWICPYFYIPGSFIQSTNILDHEHTISVSIGDGATSESAETKFFVGGSDKRISKIVVTSDEATGKPKSFSWLLADPDMKDSKQLKNGKFQYNYMWEITNLSGKEKLWSVDWYMKGLGGTPDGLSHVSQQEKDACLSALKKNDLVTEFTAPVWICDKVTIPPSVADKFSNTIDYFITVTAGDGASGNALSYKFMTDAKPTKVITAADCPEGKTSESISSDAAGKTIVCAFDLNEIRENTSYALNVLDPSSPVTDAGPLNFVWNLSVNFNDTSLTPADYFGNGSPTYNYAWKLKKPNRIVKTSTPKNIKGKKVSGTVTKKVSGAVIWEPDFSKGFDGDATVKQQCVIADPVTKQGAVWKCNSLAVPQSWMEQLDVDTNYEFVVNAQYGGETLAQGGTATKKFKTAYGSVSPDFPKPKTFFYNQYNVDKAQAEFGFTLGSIKSEKVKELVVFRDGKEIMTIGPKSTEWGDGEFYDQTAENGVTYKYRLGVRSLSDHLVAQSNDVEVVVPASSSLYPAPTLNASEENGAVLLTWVTNPTYTANNVKDIKIIRQPNPIVNLITFAGNNGKYSDTTVVGGGTYTYMLQLVNQAGKVLAVSESKTVSVPGKVPEIPTPPAKVAATPVVSATLDASAKKITVTWTDASEKGLVAGYKVFVGTASDIDASGKFDLANKPDLGMIAADKPMIAVDTANIEFLLGKGDTTRYYAIASYDKGGNQLAVGYSSGVKIEVPKGKDGGENSGAGVKPGLDMIAKYDSNNGKVAVRWTFYDTTKGAPVGSGATKEQADYNLAMAKGTSYTLTKTVDGASKTIAIAAGSSDANQFVYFDGDVVVGKTYSYSLGATLPSNVSVTSFSSSVNVPVSNVKVGLTAGLNSSDKSSVNFNWTVTGSDANIKGYALERSEDKEFGGAGGAVVTRVYPTVVTEFVKDSAATSGGTIIGGITQGKTFYYRFRGYGADNKVIVWSESLEFYVPVTAQSVNLSGFEIKTVGGAASGVAPKYIIVKYTLNGTFAGDVLTSSLHINGADVGVAEFKEKIKQANGSYAYEAILLPYELKGGDTISIKVMGPDGVKYTLGALNYGTKVVANNGGGVDETPPPDLVMGNLQAPPAVNMGLLIQTSSLPSGSVGSAYSATLSAAGGAIPYKWSIIEGSLPAGLGLNANGTLTGTPTSAGGWTFTLRASDSSSPAKNATRPFAIAIGAAGQTPPPPAQPNVTNVYNTYNTTSGGSSGGIVYVPTIPQQLGSAPTPSGSDFTFTFDTTFAAVFKDIGNHWARDYISTLFNAKIVQGFTPISFAPDKEVTRAQLLKIVLESLKYNTAVAVGTNPCKDVIKGSWYARYFALAKTSGVITGYPDGTCKPNSSASRAEAVKILFTAVQKMPFSVKTKLPVSIPANYQNTYKDVSAGQWYYPYVVSATQFGILKGYSNGTMRPNGRVTRAEMAKIMVMTLVKLVSK